MNSIVAIGSGCLICLMPLALYLLFLSYLNQRSQPTLMSGTWDFACVLLGLSGFILVGGPVFLSVFDASWRSSLFSGSFAHIRDEWGEHARIYSILAGAYIAALAAIVILFMVVRKKVTVVYNLDPSSMEETFVAAIKSSGLGWRRVVGGIEIASRANDVAEPRDEPETQKPAQIKLANPSKTIKQTATVQIEQFPFLCHSVLRWRDYDLLLRSEVEAALEKALQTKESPANSIAGWFMTASIGIFFVMLLWVSCLIYLLVVSRRGV